MSFSKIYSAQPSLLNIVPVSVETDISRGLYSFSVVGLPDKAVEEARDRVSAAVKNSNFTSPKARNHKVVVSLAPADHKKEGPSFDLPIAISYLLANNEISFNPEKKLFLGELSLDGKLRPVRGILPVARFAKENGYEELYVPKENVEEAALISGLSVFGISSLEEVVNHLTGKELLTPAPTTTPKKTAGASRVDFSDIRGQERAKRGLLIAAAGGHNVAMYGPPGTGKTMLAKAFAGILPDLSFEEALEATSIHSVAGTLTETLITRAPFRSPHHTSSYVSIVGGGATPKPGEITLAHRGVLFLDEFPEFERRVIESLRQPLEDKVISVARAKGTAHFPADTVLIAAMNPCPCGHFGFRGKPCTCTPAALSRYRRRLSGPIIDRIDLWLEVDKVHPHDLTGDKKGEGSEVFKKIVEQARQIQGGRFSPLRSDDSRKTYSNAGMSPRDLALLINIEKEASNTLNLAAEKLDFSARVYHRMLKVARTIADLAGSDTVQTEHVLEAVEYRPKKFDM